MNVEPNDLLLFARVAEAGSFSRAAERVRLPKSTVSRRIAALESQLGERLLLRTTRKLTLTDFGHSVLDHARAVADEVDAALALALHRQEQPSGRMRVSMPNDLAENVLAGALVRFACKYPQVVLELDLSPRRVDLIGEGFDLAVRMGDLPDDATLAARRLCTLEVGLYASPRYLAQWGEPQTPHALSKLHGLVLLSRGEPASWTLRRGDDRWEGTAPQRALVNSPEMLMRFAAAGFGIVALPHRFASARVEQGELARILADWQMPPIVAWAVFPGRRLMPSTTRLLLAAFEEALASC